MMGVTPPISHTPVSKVMRTKTQAGTQPSIVPRSSGFALYSTKCWSAWTTAKSACG